MLGWIVCALLAAGEPVAVKGLRCDYLTNPLGLQNPAPTLSWRVESRARGKRQSAYRVLVASRPEVLADNRGDLWDTGKVLGDETIGLAYAGAGLRSHQACHWKVRVWDEADVASAWSEPAQWSMGWLAPDRWRGEWIGYDKCRSEKTSDADLQGGRWIAHGADAPMNAPVGYRLYIGRPKLPADLAVEKAELIALADDKIWLVFNGQTLLAEAVGWQMARPIDVTSIVRPGENDFRIQIQNLAHGPAGVLVYLRIVTKDGKTSVVTTNSQWKSTDNPGANWHIREIATDDWKACKELGDYGCAPWGKARRLELQLPPPVLLRTRFQADKPVRRAVVYATALGLFDLHINGQTVNEDLLNPGWTDYTKRVYYRAYDVTRAIRKGANVFGATLADGWYSGYIGWGRIRDHYGKKPRFSGCLRLEFEDGSVAEIATGPNWQARCDGPIRETDFLMGETYDARQESVVAGWSDPSFGAEGWINVEVGAEVKPVVEVHPGPPVRAFFELPARKITTPKPGVHVVDLGQNFAGVVRLSVKEKAGQVVTLRFAERLNPDGTLYTANLREARVVDSYICKGSGVETWTPRFTFHGFQYCEVTGVSTPPTPSSITGIAISSDTPNAGGFECSDPMLNRLYQNIVWTQRANFIDIPTDCPQRDERLGWTGDAQVYIRTATLNADVQTFFRKWLVDLTDAQRGDGQFPMVAPTKVAGDDGGPAWADAGVLCPWAIYEVYGDKQLLARQYPSMLRFVEFCQKRCQPDLRPPEKFHCFGDWLSIQADTPTDVIYLAYFANSVRRTADAARVLGKNEDAKRLDALFERIKATFVKAYVDGAGKIKGDTQAVYVLALANDLVDGPKANQAAQHLVKNIEDRGGRLSTGFIGTKDLMLVLAKIDRNDVAYRLLHSDSFPSWGFSIKHGATSIWERWDGWTPEKGFQTPAMNSFAHYSFGAVYQWMFENLGGIRPLAPAYRQILVAPQLDPKLKFARVGYDSIRGQIESTWARDGDHLRLKVALPANTTGKVIIPTTEAKTVLESGKPLDQSVGVRMIGSTDKVLAVEVTSGEYEFLAKQR